MRSLKLLAVALILSAPLLALGTDDPHEEGSNCSNCHMGHSAAGAGLTNVSGNYTLCDSCHSGQSAFVTGISGQAVPGTSGRSHRWDALASNLGATPPNPAGTADEQAMAKRLDAGKLMCSTCHDQHQSDVYPTAGRGSQHLSPPVKSLAAGGTGVVTATSAPAGLASKRYLLEITTAGATGTARFRYSYDNGLSWQASNVATAASVTLSDSTVIGFGAGSFALTERYTFYVSYPFLRVDNTDSRMCVVCHKDRNMSVANVQGTGTHQGTSAAIVPGTTVFHHPVGPTVIQTAAVLDAHGGAAGTDPNPTNDLSLGTGGQVSCLTCHGIHKTDSNSLSVDQ